MGNLIKLEISHEGIALLKMQDHAGKNAFTQDFFNELMEKLTAFKDEKVKVCIFQGMDDVFCSGGDRKALLDLAEQKMEPYDLRLTRALLDIPIPAIAAMEGHATGGGLILGLSCDIVIMANESSYGCPFMNMGFTPGMGITGLLRYSMGEYLAAEMLFAGQYFRGSRFKERSLINYIEPKDKVFPKAIDIASRIAEKPRSALELLKRTLSLQRRKSFEEASTLESFMHEICFKDPKTYDRIKNNFVGNKE